MSKIVNAILGVSSRTAYRIKAQSPQILLGVGIVGITAATILACKKTLEIGPMFDDHADIIEETKHKYPYNKKKLTRAYIDAGVDLIKAYSIPAIIGVISIGCIVKGHKTLVDRNTALVGAYKLLESGYNR